ncbi:MAG: NAD-dependent epimerase/dehydratase family protein [Deinococcota bacterium]
MLVYDEAKRYAETMTLAYHRTYGLPVRIIRIFNTYGPRMDPEDGRVVTNFIAQALRGEPLTVYGDGSQTRSFQYIDDLIGGIIRLMKMEYSLPVNLGNPEEYPMRELAALIKELSRNLSKIAYKLLPQDDPRQRKLDTTFAQSLLCWIPKTSVWKGLIKTIESFCYKKSVFHPYAPQCSC